MSTCPCQTGTPNPDKGVGLGIPKNPHERNAILKKLGKMKKIESVSPCKTVIMKSVLLCFP